MVCVDSYFTYVPCAIEMLCLGIQFIAVVKTATKGYIPVALLVLSFVAKKRQL